jgi:hypothetical protein
VRAGQVVLAGLCAALVGCGGSSSKDTSDVRGAALDCLKNDKHLPARLVGRDSIQIGDPRTGPRAKFFLTSGEAEAFQFEGKAEGTEHIGKALLYVGKAGDKEIKQVEACLDDLAKR